MMKKRFLVYLLCVLTAVSMLSVPTFAQETNGGEIALEESSGAEISFEENDEAEVALEETGASELIDIQNVSVSGLKTKTYTGSAITQNLTLKYNDTVLEEDTDYYLYYSDNYDAGTATVTIVGIGLYTGERQLTFTIARKELTPKITLYENEFVYDGTVKTPSVYVEAGDRWIGSTEYTVTYAKGRKAIGKYKVTVKLKGNYSGSASTYFVIRPTSTELVSAAAINYKTVQVKWKKRGAGGIEGYQIQYSPTSDFSRGNKLTTVKGATKNTVKLTKLKSETDYYVRVRTYRTVDEKRICSAWSYTYYFSTYPHIGKPAVNARSISQIRSFIQKYPVDMGLPVSYKVKPNMTSPYKAGTLSAATRKNALNMVKQYRYIAGIDANVKLDSSYEKLAQAAALVNAANHSLCHFPDRPAGMSQSLYEQGYQGASSSNLAMSYGNTAYSVEMFMSDSDSYNIDCLGHRRWVLDPHMLKTGFGHVGAYSAMYVFDTSTPSRTFRGVVWPAQNTPASYFSPYDAWSVSMGCEVDISKVKVIVQRLSDNKKWTFSKAKSNGYFNVNNDYYGLPGCIIFRPDGLSRIKAGDRYKVTIKGMPTGGFTYTVRFFGV